MQRNSTEDLKQQNCGVAESSACSASDDPDIDLDDRIKSALREVETPKSHSRRLELGVNGYSLTRTMPAKLDNPALSDEGSGRSDSEGEDMCPSAMGYMPLPQDLDMDDSACADYEVGNSLVVVQETDDHEEETKEQTPTHRPRKPLEKGV